MHPDLQRFKVRLKLKYEIERFISLKNKNSNFFKKKWIIVFKTKKTINQSINKSKLSL